MIKVICNRCGIDMTKSGAFGRITMEIHKRSDFADSPPESMMRRCECYFCKNVWIQFIILQLRYQRKKQTRWQELN